MTPPHMKRKRERVGFSLERALLADERGQHEVIASFCGSDSAGRVWQQAFHDLLADVPTARLRRAVLAHWLLWFDKARRHGSQYRVVDADGFVGRTMESVRELDAQHVDELTGEVTCTYKTYDRHVPAFRGGSAGGLAAREKKAPRTLHRYRRILRGGHRCEHKPRSKKGRYTRQAGPGAIVATAQPPKTASDAVMPKTPGAEWAYAQAWLLLPPSPEMLRRWGYKAPKQTEKVDIGSPALPRLPSEPEALRDVLRDVREL